MKCQKRPKEEKKQPTQASHDNDGEQKSSGSEAQTDSASSYSSSGCRKPSVDDIGLVQNLIESCLQLYKTRDEVVSLLVHSAKIEPSFTSLVWQRLEEENAEFFNAYYVRLKLKKQIIIFNQLLETQYRLMYHREPHNAMLPPMQHTPMNSSVGYIASQLPYNPSNGPTRMDSLPYGHSCHVVNGIPAPGNFYPMQLNTTATGNAGGIKQEMDVKCPATDSNGQFSLAADEILHMTVDPTVDAAFSSNLCSAEGLQLAPYDGTGNFLYNPSSHLSADITNFEDLGALEDNPSSPFSISDIDTLLNSPDPCEIVDEFMADAAPT